MSLPRPLLRRVCWLSGLGVVACAILLALLCACTPARYEQVRALPAGTVIVFADRATIAERARAAFAGQTYTVHTPGGPIASGQPGTYLNGFARDRVIYVQRGDVCTLGHEVLELLGETVGR